MKLIVLNHGMMTAVDEEDYEELIFWRWKARRRSGKRDWYAMRTVELRGKKFQISMARQIMGFPEGRMVDHRSGVTLDNRRQNLRVATNAQNQHNQRRLRTDNTSGFKGVTLYRNGKWNAQIYVETRRINLGYFVDKAEAAKAYDDAAKQYFGEFAAPNTVML